MRLVWSLQVLLQGEFLRNLDRISKAAAMHLWHIVLLLSCAIFVLTSADIEGAAPNPPEAMAGEAQEAPVGEPAKETKKRSGHYCNVNGYVYQHGQIFSLPGYSHCLKYRCDNGGWSVAESACEWKSRCVPVGSVASDGCRSLRCMREDRGNMNYYHMAPSAQDRCEADGQCVPKNVDFTHKDCQTYRCLDTGNGGYQFQRSGAAKCPDDLGNCIQVGGRYSKWVNGRYYRDCVCLGGGGYSCRG